MQLIKDRESFVGDQQNTYEENKLIFLFLPLVFSHRPSSYQTGWPFYSRYTSSLLLPLSSQSSLFTCQPSLALHAAKLALGNLA
jgi:hypothetical protein